MPYTIRDVRTNEKIVETEYSRQGSAVRSFNSRLLTPQVAYIADEGWRDREAARTNLINVEQFGLVAIPDHYLHVSKKSTFEDFLVSYTENELKGRKNLQTPGRKIGRYLTEFYSSLGQERINTLTHEINAVVNKLPLEMARTSTEIREVYIECGYTSGMGSCMTHNMDNWRLDGHHPVEAYGGGDISLAYTRNTKGKITSRALVWEEKKLYNRIYGPDSSKIETILVNAGFQRGRFSGAKLATIPTPRNSRDNETAYVMPYTDDERYVYLDKNNVIRLGSESQNYRETSTAGYVRFVRYIDAITGEELSADQIYQAVHPHTGGRVYLNTATHRDHIVKAGGHYFAKIGLPPEGGSNDSWGYVFGSTELMPYYWLSRNCHQSMKSQVWIKPEEAISVDYGYVTVAEFFEDYARCEISGACSPKSRMRHMSHGAWWHPNMADKYATKLPDGTYQSQFHTQEPIAA